MDMYGLINGRKTGRILRKHALYALRGILLCFWNEEEYWELNYLKISNLTRTGAILTNGAHPHSSAFYRILSHDK